MKNEDRPWDTIASKIVYRNPWMTTYEDAIRMQNGDKGIYGYIDSKPGVFIIALTDDDKIHIIESFRHPTQRWQWELPTGGIDMGLSPLKAAKHELAEELGMIAKKWAPINTFGPSSNGFMNDTQSVFVAEELSGDGATTLEDFEVIRATKTVSLPEIMTMIENGSLSDGQSLAALMQFMVWRRSR